MYSQARSADRSAVPLRLHVQRDITMRSKPHAPGGLHVPDQFFQDEHPRAVADDVGMHGEQE